MFAAAVGRPVPEIRARTRLRVEVDEIADPPRPLDNVRRALFAKPDVELFAERTSRPGVRDGVATVRDGMFPPRATRLAELLDVIALLPAVATPVVRRGVRVGALAARRQVVVARLPSREFLLHGEQLVAVPNGRSGKVDARASVVGSRNVGCHIECERRRARSHPLGRKKNRGEEHSGCHIFAAFMCSTLLMAIPLAILREFR